jgi:hypothetical protein
MKQIMRCIFGSHLYGTSTPQSDRDFKSIFIPAGRDILLQRAKGVMSTRRPKQEFEKNVAGEEEEERFSVQRYLALLSEGQTVALDMLFAPGWAFTEEPEWEWRMIQANQDKLLTKRSAAFIGYASRQANKYGIKGSRVAAARVALRYLAESMGFHGGVAKLEVLAKWIERYVSENEHMAIVEDVTPHGQTVRMWEVCGRKMPFTASIKNAHDIMQRLVDEYGQRALAAERQEGVDWKALSHAVRVGHEAIELLTTGRITFPLPNAQHVLTIKQGGFLYQDVAREIEDLLVKVEAAAATSSLPDEPDVEWIDDFVANLHFSAVERCR